jgi:MFS family permease
MNKVKRNLVTMGLLNLLMDFKLYGAIAVIYFAKITGSLTLAMSIFSITMISAALFEVPTGILSDKIGRKKTVVFGVISSLIYSIFFAISKNYLILIIGAIIEGLERAFFSGNNDALIYDTLKEAGREKDYKEYIGKTNSMYSVAGLLSAVLGGVIAYFTSYKVIMYLSIIPKVINLLVSLFLVEPKKYTENTDVNLTEQTKNAFIKVKENKTLVKQIIADSLSDGLGEATYQFRSKFYEMVWPAWALGIPSVLSNLGKFLSEWYSKKIFKKFNNKVVLIFGYVYSIVSNIVGVLIKNVFSPFILVSNSVFPTGIAKSEISQKLYMDEYRASMASIKSLFSSISYSFFAILVGLLADLFGIVETFVLVNLFKLIVIAIYLEIFKQNKNLL